MSIDCPATIRRATLRDVSDMIRLERQSSTAAHWSEAEYGRLFQAQQGLDLRLALIADCALAEQSQDEAPTVVGFLVARRIVPEWELENVVVAGEFRGKGVGTELLQGLLAYAKQTKSECVSLEVRESNVAARRLYEKLGFGETGGRKSYYARPLEDAVLYSKALREG